MKKLKPLVHEEIIKFPCHATVEIRLPENESIIFKSDILKSQSDRICVLKSSIPLIIETLQRALITE